MMKFVLNGGGDNSSDAVTTVAMGAANFDVMLCLELKE
jgi:hypothetical protein